MKKLLLLVPILFAATPAHATGGLLCRTAGARPIVLNLVIGHGVMSPVVSARLTDAGRTVPTTLAQSWLASDEIRVALADPGAQRHELSLSASKNGAFYDGNIWRAGKRRWVRCREN